MVSLEQDLVVDLLLPIHIGNDIPKDEDGCGLKWCPSKTNWVCDNLHGNKGKGKTKETSYLMKMKKKRHQKISDICVFIWNWIKKGREPRVNNVTLKL
jgi:hypothetical protein